MHCTATSQDTKPENILKYWRERLGWKNAGYHFIIEADGRITQFQPLEKLANGVKGYNSHSIHISYIGGKDEDDRTNEQKAAQAGLVKALKAVYEDAEVLGHRDFPDVKKSCPRFDVKNWYKTI